MSPGTSVWGTRASSTSELQVWGYAMMMYAPRQYGGQYARREMRSGSICEIKPVIHCSGMESCHICRLGLRTKWIVRLCRSRKYFKGKKRAGATVIYARAVFPDLFVGFSQISRNFQSLWPRKCKVLFGVLWNLTSGLALWGVVRRAAWIPCTRTSTITSFVAATLQSNLPKANCTLDNYFYQVVSGWRQRYHCIPVR